MYRGEDIPVGVEKKEISARDTIKYKLFDLYQNSQADWTEGVRSFSESGEGILNLFQENASLFFDEIIQLVENNRDQHPEQTDAFLMCIKETFFETSPNITNYLSTSEMLLMSTRVNRVEEMRGLIGQHMIAEFVYTIVHADEGITDRLIKTIEDLPGGFREEVINQLEAAYANACGNGDWSEDAVQDIDEIISHFKKSPRPLTRIVAEVADERNRREEENPSIGVVTYTGNKGAGRLHSRVEVKSISDKVESNLPLGYKAVVVAKDAIVGVDHAGMPRFGALEDKANDILKRPDMGLRVLQNLETLKELSFFKVNLRQLIDTLGNFYGTFESDKSVPAFYANILGIPEAQADVLISEGGNIGPYFKSDWLGIQERILNMVAGRRAELEKQNIGHIEFESFEALSRRNELNPFSTVDKEGMMLLTQCLRPEVRVRLEEDLGISFSDISFRAEMALLRFISKETDETYKRLIAVLENNPTEKNRIIETFVGCAEEISFGQEFLSVCEESQGEELKTFLDIYSGVVLHTEELRDVVLADERAGELTSELAASYTKISIKKARAILEGWKEEVSKARQGKKEYVPDEEAIKRYRDEEVQSAVFASVFQQVRKEHGVEALEVMGGFESKEATTLSSKEKSDVENMYRSNYEKKDPELFRALLAVFEERCTRDGVIAYILKDHGKVISFLTVEPFQQSPGYHRAIDIEPKESELYFGSFNTDTSYQGASIGDVMMRRVIDEYAKEHVIHADCTSNVPIGAKYIEEGFVGVSTYDYKNTPSMEIVRDDERNESLQTKKMEKDIFIKDVLGFELNGGSGLCNMGSYAVSKAESQERIDMSPIDSGLILTRYFANISAAKQEWYAVFERVA